MTTNEYEPETPLDLFRKIYAVELPEEEDRTLNLEYIFGRLSLDGLKAAKFKAKVWRLLDGARDGEGD
ncbi:MAG: hypothetical protein H0X33_13440 [Taibaiella sp.]|nr:hypothetical protein [Taibaiella sp.]